MRARGRSPSSDHGAQRAPRLSGVTLGSREQLVMDVEGRLHGAILPI